MNQSLPLNTPINSAIVEQKIKELKVPTIGEASIREIVQLVTSIEAATGEKYIRMEMGIPGLPPTQIGVEAEIAALKQNVASAYPRIDGIQSLKEETSRFLKLFMNIDVLPEGCVPTVGSMEGSYAAFLVAGSCSKERDTALFVDPGFPVQKQQMLVMGQKYESFDVFDFRGDVGVEGEGGFGQKMLEFEDGGCEAGKEVRGLLDVPLVDGFLYLVHILREVSGSEGSDQRPDRVAVVCEVCI